MKKFRSIWSLFLFLQAACAVTNYTSGIYTISYDDAQFPTLRIYSADERLVWFSSEKSHALVGAAQLNRTVKQIGGSFLFNDNVGEVCTDAAITKTGSLASAQGAENVVFIEGTLCGGEASFRLNFQDTVVSAPDGSGKPFQHHHLRFNATLDDPSQRYNQLRLVYGCAADEQLYGFGAQYSKFNVKGTRLPVFLSEQGVGRGLQPLTYLLDLLSPGAGRPSDSSCVYS